MALWSFHPRHRANANVTPNGPLNGHAHAVKMEAGAKGGKRLAIPSARSHALKETHLKSEGAGQLTYYIYIYVVKLLTGPRLGVFNGY